MTRSSTTANPPESRLSGFSQFIGRTRFVVLIAVVAVMLVAFSLFVQGTVQAVSSVWDTWGDVVSGRTPLKEAGGQTVTLQFLEIVSVMLKAVVFYLIGVGLYSLFISPLNLASSLGVESLADLEHKVVSVVIVILSITFLEHFVAWTQPLETLYFGAALALAVGTLVFFQRVSHATKGQDLLQPEVKVRARRELFENDSEERVIEQDEVERAKEAASARREGEREGSGEAATGEA